MADVRSLFVRRLGVQTVSLIQPFSPSYVQSYSLWSGYDSTCIWHLTSVAMIQLKFAYLDRFMNETIDPENRKTGDYERSRASFKNAYTYGRYSSSE